MIPTTSASPAGAMTRRRWLHGMASTISVAISGSAVRGVPMVWAQNIKNVTLRQFGTGVSNINEISRKAKEDLGFTLTMTALDSDAVVQRAVTQPKSYDIADIEYWMAKKVVPTGVLLPLDTQRIKLFDKIVPVFITGKLTPEAKVAQGTAPHTVEFVTGADSAHLAAEPTRWATLIPTIYNADTLGIRPDLVKRPIDTWAELLNPEFKGRASILNIPSIGIMDAAIVCESVGAITYRDKGNMTKDELDKTMKVLTDAKKTGQFRAFWKTFDESVNLMASLYLRNNAWGISGGHSSAPWP
jgi:putative spermidine/putrescine transport system substrate-binding protein